MAKNPKFEETVKRNKQGEFSDKDKNVQPTTGMSVNMPYEEPETPTIHRLASDLFNYGKGVKETRVVSCIFPDDTIRIDFEDGRIIMGGFDPDYPSCFTFSEYMSQEELDETSEACTDTYDFEGSTDPYAATRCICQGLSDSAIREIAESSAPYNRVVAAKDTQASPETLAQLAQDENRDVRIAVATNLQNLSEETFNRLASDSEHEIRGLIADRKDAPAHILNRLSRDDNEFVRQAVAENRSTPAETFARLAEDEKPSVRRFVARNPSTPSAVLEHLAYDKDSFASQYACDTLREQDEETYYKLAAKLIKRD